MVFTIYMYLTPGQGAALGSGCVKECVWQDSMIGKVWERTHFRRGTKGDREPPVGLRWKQWSLVRGPGCECDHIPWWPKGWELVWLHLSWSTKECLSGCDEWMWVWMDFSFLSFCPVTTPCKGEAVTLWWQPSLGIKKKTFVSKSF